MSSFSRDHTTPYSKGTAPGTSGRVKPWKPCETHTFHLRYFHESILKAVEVEAEGQEEAIWKFVQGQTGIVYVYVGGARVPREVDTDAKTISRPSM